MRRFLLATMVMACAPLAVVWAMGPYDRLVIRDVTRELATTAEALARGGERGWAEAAERHRVFVRILDAQGTPLQASDPRWAEGRWGEGWWTGFSDFFFGPEGPPDLVQLDAALGPVAQRPEVIAALGEGTGHAMHTLPGGHAFVFFHARVVPDSGRVVHLTRISRRTVRALYDVRYQLLKLTIALVGGALAMGLWLGWTVVRPIVELERQVRAHGFGRGAPTTLALDRRDEIGALSRELDALARRLRERLERTAQATADLAHDLKSPISTVTSSVELLESDRPLDEERRLRIATAVGGAATHLRRSVEAMLALARLDEQLPNEAHVPLDLVAVVARVIAETRTAIPVTTTGPPQAWVSGHAERLGELLTNLLTNAAVFARQRIEVAVALTDHAVTVTIADDGPGVTAGNRAMIFQRFFTVRPDGAPPGSGLGLTIAQAIAEAHGGRVELAEAGPLPGACFRVVLPRSAPAAR